MSRGLAGFLAALVIWFLFIHRLGDRDLWSSHEARSGMNARTILEGGLWWLPGRTNELPDVQKPPMYYWMVAYLSGEPGKVDPWTIRLPSTLGALVCILNVYCWGRLLGKPLAGVLGALILASAIHFVWSSRIGRIDMVLAGAVSSYFLFSLRYVLFLKTRDLVLASLMVAISILLKGPVGLALCGFSALAILLPLGRNITSIWGLGLTGLLGLLWVIPWFWAAHLGTDGEFSRLFFLEHNLDRGLGSGRLRSHPIWFYPVQFLWDFQPWTTLIPLTLIFVIGNIKIKLSFHYDKYNYLFVLSFLFSLLFLSINSFKRSDYLLPAYPAAAFLMGIFFNRLINESRNLKLRKIALGSMGVGIATTLLVFAWLLYVDIPAREPARLAKDWARQTDQFIGEDEEIIFFAEEAHSVAFHLNRPHQLLGTPEAICKFLEPDKPVWIYTNPQVLGLWPSGPPGILWTTVSSNIQTGDGQLNHKPLVLLKAFPDSKPR